MDILLLQASVLHLPTSHRASAIVFDGTRDFGLWRPPGPDRDLADTYGDELRAVLDKEKKRLPGGKLELGGLVRVHPGKLHCDFLVWVATREPHGETSAAAAPNLDTIQNAARRVIEFCAEHDVVRLAFPALGRGVGEAPAAERMAAIVRAAAAYKEACFKAERPTHMEEIVVCDPSSAHVAKAKHMVERLARTGFAEAPQAARPSAPSKPRSASSAAGGSSTARKRGQPKLSPEQISAARARAAGYDRTRLYYEGEWLIHPTFGVGQVQVVKPERMVTVLFENGELKNMIHGR